MSRWLGLSLVLTVAALASSLYVGLVHVGDLPPRVPVHWDINGKPDQTVPREELVPYLLIAPGTMALMVVLTLILPWLSPRQFEVAPFRKVFNYVMGLLVILFGYIHVLILWSSLDENVSLIRWLLGGLFLFFALLGNVLGKVRRNFWMGVRTPWTLASERVWNQTHRLTAWLFVVYGLAAFAAVLAGVPPIWCLAGLIALALTSVVYSLVLYKTLEKQGKL
jgi:uncharacterized membrane protein